MKEEKTITITVQITDQGAEICNKLTNCAPYEAIGLMMGFIEELKDLKKSTV